MNIDLKKFGFVLTSRQSGKEAYAAYLPTLGQVSEGEDVIVDFSDVYSFSPSWGDEFLTPLLEKFGERLVLRRSVNPSVALTVETLEEILGKKFRVE